MKTYIKECFVTILGVLQKNDNNSVNESHLFIQGKAIVKTYTTTAREPSIYPIPEQSQAKVPNEEVKARDEANLGLFEFIIEELRMKDQWTNSWDQ